PPDAASASWRARPNCPAWSDSRAPGTTWWRRDSRRGSAPRRRACSGRPRASCSTEQTQERGFVENLHAESPGVVGLASGRLADHDVRRLLRDGGRNASTGTLDQFARRVAREGGQRAGHDERLACERLRPLGFDAGFGRVDAGLGEAPDHVPVRLVLEESFDGLRQLVADAADLVQLGLRRALQPRHAPELVGEQGGYAVADEADPERVEQARETAHLAGRNRRDQILRGSLGEALEVRYFADGQRVEVGEVLHAFAVHELLDDGFPKMLDVHRAPRAEVAQASLELRRTRRVQTAPVRFAGQARGRMATHGTTIGEDVGDGVGRTLGHHDLDDVRDDVAGALDENRVADADVLAPHLVFV